MVRVCVYVFVCVCVCVFFNRGRITTAERKLVTAVCSCVPETLEILHAKHRFTADQRGETRPSEPLIIQTHDMNQ